MVKNFRLDRLIAHNTGALTAPQQKVATYTTMRVRGVKGKNFQKRFRHKTY